MTATEVLREEVKHYIEQADDKSLRMVKAILEIEQEADIDEESMEEENWDDLPKELQVLLTEAVKECEEGKVTPHARYWKNIANGSGNKLVKGSGKHL